jgi:hypothetical protein
MGVFELPKEGVQTNFWCHCKLLVGWWWTTQENALIYLVENVFLKETRGMGFHDLHSFNLAMLAKQVWRLLDNPDSLCAKVLKAKYYPNCHILQVGKKSGSSFTWQRIASGIQTFKRGCIWRIGDRQHVDIWSDPWIPSSPNRKILTQRGTVLLSNVHELINHLTGQWDQQLVQSIFSLIDAQRILANFFELWWFWWFPSLELHMWLFFSQVGMPRWMETSFQR